MEISSGRLRGESQPTGRISWPLTLGVGALSTPGTTVLILTAVALRPSSVASQRRVPTPRHNHHRCGTPHHEASTKGSSDFPRPIFPSPVAPGWRRAPLGFLPSFAPGPYEPRTSGWGQAVEHGPATRSTSSRPSLQSCGVDSMRATSRRTRPSGSQALMRGSNRPRGRSAFRTTLAS
jgi:hypothetical protein